MPQRETVASRRNLPRRVVPGFGLSLGYTITYLSLVVLIPLSALFSKSFTLGWSHFWQTVGSDEVLSAYSVTLIDSAAAAAVNLVLGLLVAWVLVRYSFPGRRAIDALVDLPFMLPTAVAGITLFVLYSDRGWVGMLLNKIGFHYYWPIWRGFHGAAAPGVWARLAAWWPFGYENYRQVTFAPLGVVVALVFIGMPFVIRTVQPVLEDMSREMEEAAASLGARRLQAFRHVVLPQLAPALLTGFSLAFARGLGEYGSVVFISANQPNTEIAPLRIVARLENDDYAGATAVAVVLLVISFALLLAINVIQRRTGVRTAA